jgi:hypothetical protein
MVYTSPAAEIREHPQNFAGKSRIPVSIKIDKLVAPAAAAHSAAPPKAGLLPVS